MKARAIDVSTDGTTVTVSGTVGSVREHDRALVLARETVGVSTVIDRLVPGFGNERGRDLRRDLGGDGQRVRDDARLRCTRRGKLRGLADVLAQHDFAGELVPQPGLLQRLACGASVGGNVRVGNGEVRDVIGDGDIQVRRGSAGK